MIRPLLLMTALLAAASAGAQTPPLLTALDLNTRAVLEIPLRSQAIMPDPRATEAAALRALALADYDLRCQRANRLVLKGTSYVMHEQDIARRGRVGTMSTLPLIARVECSEPGVDAPTSGIVQAVGTVRFTLNPEALRGVERAKRQLYHLALPVRLNVLYVDEGSAYVDAACQQALGNVGRWAMLFAWCEAPTVTRACCANTYLETTMHALVFAYENPVLADVTHTGRSENEVMALNARTLSDVTEATRGADIALEQRRDAGVAAVLCTPPTWEYAPTMAFQSRCITVRHTYQPSFVERLRCEASVDEAGGGTATLYARLIDEDGAVWLEWISRGTRMLSSTRERASMSTDGLVVTVQNRRFQLRSESQDMRAASSSFPATLSGTMRANAMAESHVLLCVAARAP